MRELWFKQFNILLVSVQCVRYLSNNEELVAETDGYHRDALLLAQDRTDAKKQAKQEPLYSWTEGKQQNKIMQYSSKAIESMVLMEPLIPSSPFYLILHFELLRSKCIWNIRTSNSLWVDFRNYMYLHENCIINTIK